jgi:DNA repair exonuclease SbcCD ATPase subunit
MTSPAEANNHKGAEVESHELANVDKIREILFGGQMRDYDKRFARVEERLAKDIEILREDFKKRMEVLEGFIREEVESVTQRLKAEKTERVAALKELDRALREAQKESEKELSQLEDALAKKTTELRTQLLDQSNTLAGEIEGKHHAMAVILDREVQTLQDEKADRAGLSDLFTEIALRLKKDFELPESHTARAA